MRTLAVGAALITGGLAGGAVLGVRSVGRCDAPGEADKARLVGFVRLKYNLPASTEIGVADGGVALNSCFRKLVFAALSGGRPFRIELFASPDFRFLTSELLDARPDPKQEAEQRRQIAESLVRGDEPSRGNDKAPSTLVVFSDFQCPYCARMARTAANLAAREGDRLRIVYHYFPLSIHQWARPAAEAAACAQRQGSAAFWSLHDFLFVHQKEISTDNLQARIEEWELTVPGLDSKIFSNCIGRSLTSGQVEQDVALGNDVGVQATPTVFLNGEHIEDTSAENLKAIIERAPGTRQ